jgi:hypothetical protein
MEPKLTSDGYVDFSGGMDSYTSPSTIQKNQYVCSVNMRLNVGKRGISTRQGFREIKLNFKNKKEEELYRSNPITGCGYYLNNSSIVQMVSCSGRMLELREVSKWEYDVRLVNVENNPKIQKTYFSSVPDGLIINDGESTPIYAQKLSYRRTNTDEIGAGFAGVFVQNRFFYVSSDRKKVIASSYNNPTSLEEARLNNFDGYFIPDNNFITAIGEQKTLSKDSQGGSLVISSYKNIYSVEVSSPMSQWGSGNSGVVSGDIYDIGAVSQNSFLSLNGNVYFRSRSLGLVSLQYLQYIFNNQDIIEKQSYGGDLLFNNDESAFLESCHSVKYKNKIYTTVSPDMSGYGVYWNGMLVCKPEQKGLIKYESLYTGVRPWCLCQVDDVYGEEFMYIHSFDHDDVNRMYILDDNADMDYSIGKKPKEIESKLFTRMMSFDNGFAQKKPDQQFYSLSEMSRDVCIEISTRKTSNTSFSNIFSTTHKNYPMSIEKGIFVNTNESYGSRDAVPFSDSSGQFLLKQDLIKILGYCNIDSILRLSSATALDKVIHLQEKENVKQLRCNEELFSYKIQNK